MSETGWLVLAIAAAVLAAVGWLVRERWVARRWRRRRRP
jgi:hypothetical protein